MSYSVNPNYQYPRNGGKPTITGYSAMNMVEVTMGDPGDAGKVIDLAAEGGANQIERLQFTLKDEKPARAEAPRQATVETRSNAEAMAGARGLKFGRVSALEQASPQMFRPVGE